MPSKTRVLIVDDSRFARQLLKVILEADERFHVVGMADDGRAGLKLANSLSPDIITLDLDMPELDGRAALAELRKTSSIPVVIVSATPSEVTRQMGFEVYEPVGFVTKNLAESQLDLSLFTAELVRELTETIERAQAKKVPKREVRSPTKK